jgi:ATP-dependent DNA ligase
MEALLVRELPKGRRWQYEPKWDGFRCIAEKRGTAVALISKSEKPLGRYFPEIEDALAAVSHKRFVVDGELCIFDGSGLSFEALQMRLHPAASRVARLAQETPALFILFDLLSIDGEDIRKRPLSERREGLEALFADLKSSKAFRLSPRTKSFARATTWLEQSGTGAMDGVVAKRLDEPYRSGERTMMKVKRVRTADCVVGGFRYGSHSRLVGSLLLGLYAADGKLDHVGFTSGIADDARANLTKRLEKLRGGAGFSGSAPGGPSRWATERSGEWVPLRNKLVAEVQFDQVSGGRFRHGTRFLRWRPDKAPLQCTMEQLGVPSAGALVRGLLK